jgi:hypothetical protein
MILCTLDRSSSLTRLWTLNLSPIAHCSADASQTSDLNDLLMPAQEHTHGCSGGLIRARSPGDLAETSRRLRCNLVW